ncbi:pheromone-regulated protein [Saccharomycopsis crataegensis]|uniref:Pheromone-regulated membrane protein 10 n=1 Tax=Saccharomycopsis crataegensis TaxID=43959 RepID=A0AAV5QWD9_9ASCO|nr:pheromone-regulated protein [Saccharomycopsis crataegensis]
MPNTPPATALWNKKKKPGLNNTPQELSQDYFSLPVSRTASNNSSLANLQSPPSPSRLSPNIAGRPQYRRSKSSQSILKNTGGSPTIPEGNPVSHATTPSLPTFKSIGNHMATSNVTSSENLHLSNLSDDKRRKRANSVERDANLMISQNIVNPEYGEIPESDGESEKSITSNNNEKSPNNGKTIKINDPKQPTTTTSSPSKKKAVIFYDSDDDSDSSTSNKKDKEKITDDEDQDEIAAQQKHNNADVTSIASDSHAGNFLMRILNFKQGLKKKDDESIIENQGEKPNALNFLHPNNINDNNSFELNLFSEHHPRRYLHRRGSNNSDGDIADQEDEDNEEEAARVQEEVNKIMGAHESSRLGKILHRRKKSSVSNGSSGNANKNTPLSISRSSSKTSLSDLFYAHNNQDPLEGTPDNMLKDTLDDDEYIPPPNRVQEGILSTLMKLYTLPQEYAESSVTMNDRSSFISGSTAFEKDNKPRASKSGMASPSVGTSASSFDMPSFKPSMTKEKKANLSRSKGKLKAKITVHLASLFQKRNFIIKMCTALMTFGAPTYRLEEYMVMTSRVLEIDSYFIYFPGCMIMAFNDPTTKTTEMQLVRTKEGVNLSKLHDTHQIYKAVIHDLLGVEEATKKLDALCEYPDLYPGWVRVLVYGLGSAMVCPFAFNGNWVDMPICFLIGCCVAVLQVYVAPRSSSYTNVFEVAASIVVSFLGRALGSINGGKLFCFSALVQGSLALILPGFIILTGSLELQSRSIVNGSVRMFYAIIYSLFLSFGITIGAALYGWIDKEATSNQTCVYKPSLSPYYRFLFVPVFSISLALLNQASWKQLPVMVGIACAGYVVSYFCSLHFSSSSEFTSAIAAMVIGVLGNLYSRIYRGLAISAMLPAIFVQVPSGIASQSSLLAGISSANEIVSSLNGTSTSATTTSDSSDNSLSFGFSMIQVAIGISVGLFAASILVYPVGKKSTALFTL